MFGSIQIRRHGLHEAKGRDGFVPNVRDHGSRAASWIQLAGHTEHGIANALRIEPAFAGAPEKTVVGIEFCYCLGGVDDSRP